MTSADGGAVNLFPIGTPAGDGHVVGREQHIREVQQRLMDGHSVMMAGPRRIGKSSVAWEVLRRLRDAGAYTASVDLFHVATVEELAAKLLQSVLENRSGVRSQTAKAMKNVRELLGNAALRAKVHDLELGVALERPVMEPTELLELAIATAEKLARQDDRRLVVLLDEFQEIERIGGETLLKRLRASFQGQEYTRYLFLGSQTTMMRTLFSDQGQAFYRFAVVLALPPVLDSAWRQYISERLAAQRITITDPALDLLLQKTGGHPYCVMSVAYNAYLHAKLTGLAEVSADVVFLAYEQTLITLDGVYEAQLAEIHRGKHADAVLAALIDRQAPYSLPLANSAVSKAISYLLRISVLTRHRRGEYALIEPMFGDWLRRNL